tara:strand:+ start:5115 stop:6029 length:915 start_codon:yes stop_codon:yes gene_type:complete
MYKKIEEINTKDYKKVFVVGDIHGSFKELEKALYSIQFDKENDLLICVGDLVGRGEDSYLAGDYLRQEWFKSAVGNHDLLFIEKEIGAGLIPQIDSVEYDILFYKKLKNDFIDAYRDSPLIFEVTNREGEKIIISHAGLPLGEDKKYEPFKKKIIEKGLSVTDVKELTWERSIAVDLRKINGDNTEGLGRKLKSPVARTNEEYELFTKWNSEENDKEYFEYLHKRNTVVDVDYVFHGHNVMLVHGLNKESAKDLLRLGNRFLIDTGGYFKTDNYKLERESLINNVPVGLTIFDLDKMKCVYAPK